VLERQNGGGEGSVAAASECGEGDIFLDLCFFYGRVEYTKVTRESWCSTSCKNYKYTCDVKKTLIAVCPHLTVEDYNHVEQILQKIFLTHDYQVFSTCFFVP